MRMQYAKMKGTTKTTVASSDFQLLQTTFLAEIRTVVTFENIPANLILNQDPTSHRLTFENIPANLILNQDHMSH